MISMRRVVGCLAYYLRHFAQSVVQHRLISVLSAVYTRALRDTEDSAVSGNASRPMAKYCKDDDSKLWDRQDNDSDSDESFTCEYDSTWDEEDNTESDTRKTLSRGNTYGWKPWSTGRNKNAARDMQIYRQNYPDLEDQVFSDHHNLKFYRNEIASIPDCLFIEEYHNKWRGDYSRLERVHTFIQWLFPIQEDGMNYQASKLTKDEIKAFTADETAKERLKTSYELMLDFYGIKLVNHQTGEVERAENWEDRFYNLNKHTHNNLRITRILKCLGTLGFAGYQAPLVRFFLKETLENGELRNVKRSVLDYFLFSVLDKSQRRELIREAFVMFHRSRGSRTRRGSEKFVWCPKWVQKRFLEELKREEIRTKPANQSPGCGDKTQPIIEKNTSEAGRDDSQLEGDGLPTENQVLTSGTQDDQVANNNALSGDSLDNDSSASKQSDKDEETLDRMRQDEAESKNTDAPGIAANTAVEAQININKAAGIAEEAQNNINKAAGIAEEAQININKVAGIAEEAQNNRNKAAGIAEEAQNNMNKAAGIAEEAQNNMNKAAGIAEEAQNNMNKAAGIAEEAQNNMNKAAGIAEEAQNNRNKAAGIAEEAQNNRNKAAGIAEEAQNNRNKAAGIAEEAQNNRNKAAGIAEEAQNNRNDKEEGQNANSSAATHDSLVNGSLTNEQLHGENPTQYSAKESDSHTVPEHAPSNKDPRTVADDKLEDPECRTQGVRPAGGFTGPSNRDKAEILDNKNNSTDISTARNLLSSTIDGSDQDNATTMEMAVKLNSVKDADNEKPVEMSVEKSNGNSLDEQPDSNVCSQPDCNEGRGLELLGDSVKKGSEGQDEAQDITVPKEDHHGDRQASQEHQAVETADVSATESPEVEETKF